MADHPSQQDEFISTLKQQVNHKIEQLEQFNWETTQQKMTSLFKEPLEIKKQIHTLLQTIAIFSTSQKNEEFSQRIKTHLDSAEKHSPRPCNSRIEVDGGIIHISFEPSSTVNIAPIARMELEMTPSTQPGVALDTIHVSPAVNHASSAPNDNSLPEDPKTSLTQLRDQQLVQDSDDEPLQRNRRRPTRRLLEHDSPPPAVEAPKMRRRLTFYADEDWPTLRKSHGGHEELVKRFDNDPAYLVKNCIIEVAGANCKWAMKHNKKQKFNSPRTRQFESQYPHVDPPDRKAGRQRQPDQRQPTPARADSGGGGPSNTNSPHPPRQLSKVDRGYGHDIVILDELSSSAVLHWGRRKNPKEDPRKNKEVNNLDEHETKSFLWTPPGDGFQPDDKQGDAIKDENQPTFFNPQTKKQETVNLFCSGHCLMPDGNLLVTGGHLEDGLGVNQACIFDRNKEKWIPQPPMHNGRWYPSVLAMPDGRMLCMSGSFQKEYSVVDSIPQLFSADTTTSSATAEPKPGNWTEVKDSYGLLLPPSAKHATHMPIEGVGAPNMKKLVTPLYPRLHVDPTDGQLFMTGPTEDSLFLQIKASADAQGADLIDEKAGVVGCWKLANTKRNEGFRDYAPSVMYAPGKIMYMGGGFEKGSTGEMTEFIDLNKKPAAWEKQKVQMNNPRRQFNGTVLADGKVLVTGGTSGSGFNNLDSNVVVRIAEMMDPEATNREWIEMDEEENPRCYHSIALLLPDGRVLSAGGGEYGGCDADDCHADGQLFAPPYLFIDGPRPTIATKAADIKIPYDKEFSLTVGDDDRIGAVNLVKLGSVTHCNNFGQQFVPLTMSKKQEGNKIFYKGPKNPNYAPPGYYMLFILNESKKPSVATIVQIAQLPSQNSKPKEERCQPTLLDRDQDIKKNETRPHAKVGITPLCPYGLGPCWAGAHDGLQAISDIDVVRPVPNNEDCLAYVYLKQDKLPDLDVWRKEFRKVANQGYIMRGIDMCLSGVVTKGKSGADELVLNAKGDRPEVTLRPFKKASQLRWNIKEEEPRPVSEEELGMYKKLVGAWVDRPAGVEVEIKGTLQKEDNDKFTLDVRKFKTLNN
ncbi:hypothetical protein E8E14_008981 [Neopestalotiopsis sp. 37M]|nr:hypothetical protein E8E14_008981 [Neopestalotiopsis sp. 37M]